MFILYQVEKGLSSKKYTGKKITERVFKFVQIRRG